MFELMLNVPGWIADRGNNTWWTHMGGIHPAMPGSPMPSLTVMGAWEKAPKKKAKAGNALLECPM
jgi:hypothetical protein